MQQVEGVAHVGETAVVLGETFVLGRREVGIPLPPEPLEEQPQLARRGALVDPDLVRRCDRPRLLPDRLGRVEVGIGESGVVPHGARRIAVPLESGLGAPQIRLHVMRAPGQYQRRQRVGTLGFLQGDGDLRAMGQRHRVVGMARQGAVRLTPDVGGVIELAEGVPAIAEVGPEGENLEDRLAHHPLTLVASRDATRNCSSAW